MGHKKFLLKDHNIIRTKSKEAIHEQVSQHLCQHRMRIVDSADLASRLCVLNIDNLTFIELEYGANVEIDPGDLSELYLFRLTMEGEGGITYDNETVAMRQGFLTISSPCRRGVIRTDKGCHNLIIKVRRQKLENRLSNRIEQRLTNPINFDRSFGPDHPGTVFIRSTLEYFFQIAFLMKEPSGLSDKLSRMENYFYDFILDLLPHNYSDKLDGNIDVLPRYVKVAKQHIDDHLEEGVTSESLAQLAGVSVRTIQHGFTRFLGMPPKAYLTQQRIRAVHKELSTATQGASVTDIVTSCGIQSFGHFSAQYKSIYGETPRHTLKRSIEHTS